MFSTIVVFALFFLLKKSLKHFWKVLIKIYIISYLLYTSIPLPYMVENWLLFFNPKRFFTGKG